MRVSYLIFNDRRSEFITGKHKYISGPELEHIMCEEITKPIHQALPKEGPFRLVLDGKEYCTKMSGMVYLRVKFTYGFHFIKNEIKLTNLNCIIPYFRPIS
jgi:hypothetical protein